MQGQPRQHRRRHRRRQRHHCVVVCWSRATSMHRMRRQRRCGGRVTRRRRQSLAAATASWSRRWSAAAAHGPAAGSGLQRRTRQDSERVGGDATNGPARERGGMHRACVAVVAAAKQRRLDASAGELLIALLLEEAVARPVTQLVANLAQPQRSSHSAEANTQRHHDGEACSVSSHDAAGCWQVHQPRTMAAHVARGSAGRRGVG
jgi:hypothetical protein